ncbi:hypothetical protein [Natrinema ejinorense]|uniref:DUF1059 domain-containing protein n=1 Tax=Natrinema ejinorense TaxID=373386 RepID=A0A2A5QQK8_9EURY|nr:hypothetical protein [Natrinema ejinorense]PCR89121.1 hypothetical protein CP557_00370 [Natrinema ejinorense]
MLSAYCGECEWQYRAEGDATGDCSRAMIDHFVETGHSPIERRDAAAELVIDDRFDPVDAAESGRDLSKK